MSFQQTDRENTFTEFGELLFDVHPAAATIGLASLALLVLWEWIRPLKTSGIPAPLVVVLVGVSLSFLFNELGGRWVIEASHRVQVPVAETVSGVLGFLRSADFSQWANPAAYLAAVTIALVASLETLVSIEAVDKIDPKQRTTPASRELVAQGVGNVTLGLIGGLPITPVIVRSTVNVASGAQTKLSTIFHGVLLAVSVIVLPQWINAIPLSCLAAILLFTGFQLINPAVVRGMWQQGRYQFVPFLVTIVAIVMTDLLVGVIVGLAVSVSFILNSNLRTPIRRVREKHLGGEVLRVELPNQVSFLKKAALSAELDAVPRGGHLLLDARNTDYIDPDVLDMIREFKDQTAPARRVDVSLLGFRSKYRLKDQIQYVDYSTRELQSALTPQQALEILQEGHRRFRSGDRLNRDLARQVDATAAGQHPFAVVLSCIDSRAPAELIFDAGVGDIFSARVAGNIVSRKMLGSIEYACAVAGAKLVLVMGHTRCGAVTTAVKLTGSPLPVAQTTGCQNVEPILQDIQESVDPQARASFDQLPSAAAGGVCQPRGARQCAANGRTHHARERNAGQPRAARPHRHRRRDVRRDHGRHRVLEPAERRRLIGETRKRLFLCVGRLRQIAQFLQEFVQAAQRLVVHFASAATNVEESVPLVVVATEHASVTGPLHRGREQFDRLVGDGLVGTAVKDDGRRLAGANVVNWRYFDRFHAHALSHRRHPRVVFAEFADGSQHHCRVE